MTEAAGAADAMVVRGRSSSKNAVSWFLRTTPRRGGPHVPAHGGGEWNSHRGSVG
jgi:hypothetical protein